MNTLLNPILIIVRGLPGSGKSFIAEHLQRDLHLEYGEDNVVMLDPDATDYASDEYKQHVQQLTLDGVDPALHAYRFLRAKAYQAIADRKIIMWNQPFTNIEIFNKMMANLKLCAQQHNAELSVLIVEVMIDPTLAYDRVKQRKAAGGHGPSEATFARRVADYTSFAEHGYAAVTVQGDADIQDSLKIIHKSIASIVE